MEEEERDQKAEFKRKSDRKTALVFLAVSLALFVCAIVLAGLNIARLRNLELDNVRTIATVTGVRTESKVHQGTHRTRQYYYRIFTYEFNGGTFQGEDGEGWKAYKENMLGKEIEIYVDPNNPSKAVSVSSSDTFSAISVTLFAFSLPLFVAGAAIMLQVLGRNCFRKRLFIVWLPIVLVCLAVTLLFWVGLPHDGFGAVFGRMRGAIGYSVLGGVALIGCGIDALAARKKRK